MLYNRGCTAFSEKKEKICLRLDALNEEIIEIEEEKEEGHSFYAYCYRHLITSNTSPLLHVMYRNPPHAPQYRLSRHVQKS